MKFLSFATLVQQAATAAQAASKAVLDFTVGSILRAIMESVAGIVMWLQYLIVEVLRLTRAATATGADLDTWLADFSFARLPAVAATGNVTFSRYSAAQAALILPGTVVSTADGSQSFTVSTNTANGLWSAGQGGYVIPANTTSGTVPVIASVGGIAGNAAAGTVTVIGTALANVDTVTNAGAFTGGINAESDTAARARFALYIAGLRRATLAAIQSAIAGVQQGLVYNITENYDASNVWTPGLLTIVVDDGSGAPSTTLLDQVRAAVDGVRAASVRFTVSGPSVVTANVSMTVTTGTGYSHSTVATAAQSAVAALINALPVGATLSYTRVAAVVWGASPGITNVTSLTVNSGTADITATASQVIRAGTVTVS